MDNNEIGLRIRRGRKALGLTIEEFADRVAVSSALVYAWESGRLGLTRKRIEPVAQHLGMDIKTLLFGSTDQDIERVQPSDISNKKWKAFVKYYRKCCDAEKALIAELTIRMSQNPAKAFDHQLGKQNINFK